MIREVSPFWFQANSATVIKNNFVADNPNGSMESQQRHFMPQDSPLFLR
jgi:hypothetical protein